MGLPCYSFIILQSFQTNSDTIWVIINHSQCSAPAQLSSACSSLAYETFKINSIAKLISVNYAILEGEEEGKQFPETSGGFLLTLPPQHPPGEGTSCSSYIFPRNGLWFQFCIPKANTAACQTSLLPREEAQRMLCTKPFRWWCLTAVRVPISSSEQFVPPAHKASCPKCHPTAWHHDLTQTSAEIESIIQLKKYNPSWKMTEGMGVGWKGQGAESSLSKTHHQAARDATGTLPFLSHCTCSSLQCQEGMLWGQSQAATSCHCN